MLRFICTKSLEGEAGSINEWTIAIDGLRRRNDFDPERDSIVRVEFHHLRKRLNQYYETEGANHVTRISLPATGYVPRFITVPPALPPPEPVAPAVSPTVERRSRLFPIGAAIGLAAALLGAIWMLSSNRGSARDMPRAAAITPSSAPNAEAVRILVGFSGPRYIDSSGRPWTGDAYATGGATYNRSDRRIYRTLDEVLYQTGREGEFHYDIPMKPGVYELRLHFAETRYGQSPLQGAEAQRRFCVHLNGNELLHDFDIVNDAGGADIATVKVWTDVAPSEDGYIHLTFDGHSGPPTVNAIEITPGISGQLLPVRVLASMHPVYDRKGQLWQADQYFLGGRLGERSARLEGADDLAKYPGKRYGNFSYAIPVVRGRTYQATMTFEEGTYPNVGDRLFDIFLNNNRSLITDFDVVKETGGKDRAAKKVFKGLKPNWQDKLLFSFVPRKDYAEVSSIEVLQESARR